jgi:hypothetical protein
VLVCRPNFGVVVFNLGQLVASKQSSFLDCFASRNSHHGPQGEHKLAGVLLGWIMDSVSITWNCLCWFAILTLGVVVLHLAATFVASNLHFWTVSLHETVTMTPKVNIN